MQKYKPDHRMLEKILDHSPDVICTINKDGYFLWLNKTTEKVWGYKPEELIGKKYLEYVVSEDHLITEQTASLIIEGNNFTNFENRYIHKNGTAVPMVWSATWDNAEKIIHCVARDANEKKHAENLLKEQQQLLKSAMKMAKMGNWEYDVRTNTAIWSEELMHIFGLRDVLARKDLAQLFMSMVHPDDLHILAAQFANIDRLASSFHHRLIRADGKIIYIEQAITKTINKGTDTVHVAGTAQDITERMEHQQKLEASERRFRSLVQNGSDLICILDEASNYKYIVDNSKTMLGYESSYFKGKNAFDFIHPDDADAVRSQLSCLTETYFIELPPFRFVSANGDWRWIESKLTNRLNDPAIEGIVVNSRDITDRKAAQDRIARLSKIAEETGNAVVITDPSGRITWVNAAFTRITGYQPGQAEGKKPGDLLQGPETDADTIAYMRQCVEEGKPFDVEIVNYNTDKKPYWMHIQCQPQMDENNRIVSFFAIQTDISERKKLQARLNQEIERRQKQITTAIVRAQEKERNEIGCELHDNVNQILSTVKLYLSISREPEVIKEELVSKSISLIQDCINEIRDISKRLSGPDRNDLKLDEAIKDLIDSIALTGKIYFTYTPYHIADCELKEEVQLAIYRITQEQLTNILKHAEADAVDISLSCREKGMELCISDNGVGFDTSKKRNGIGISNMINRAETVNGKIEIKSMPGQGCTLHGLFPCC